MSIDLSWLPASVATLPWPAIGAGSFIFAGGAFIASGLFRGRIARALRDQEDLYEQLRLREDDLQTFARAVEERDSLLEDMESQLDGLEAQVQSAEFQKRELELQLEHAQAHQPIHTTSEQWPSHGQVSETIAEPLAAVAPSEDLARLQRAYRRCREAWDEVRKERDRYRHEIRALERKLHDLDGFQQELTRAQQTISQRDAQIKELEQQCARQVAASERDQTQILRLRKTIARGQEQKALVERTLRTNLDRAIAHERREVDRLRQSIAEQQADVEKSRAALEQAALQNERLEHQLAQTQRVLDSTMEELDTTAWERDEEKTRAEQLSAQLGNHADELRAARDQLHKGSRPLAFQLADTTPYQSRIELLEKSLLEREMELEQLRVQIHAQPSISPLVEQGDELNNLSDALATVSKLRLELDTYQRRHDAQAPLVDENVQLRVELQEAQRQVERMKLIESELAELRAAMLAVQVQKPLASHGLEAFDSDASKPVRDDTEIPAQAIASRIEQGFDVAMEGDERCMTERLDEQLKRVLEEAQVHAAVLADTQGFTIWGATRSTQIDQDSLAAIAAEGEILSRRARELLGLATIDRFSLIDQHGVTLRGSFLPTDGDLLTLVTLGPSSSSEAEREVETLPAYRRLHSLVREMGGGLGA